MYNEHIIILLRSWIPFKKREHKKKKKIEFTKETLGYHAFRYTVVAFSKTCMILYISVG